jgi:adenylate cyclase
MSQTRRLAAILGADVAGYSRLMGEDEAGTAQALREHRAAADPLIAEHGGRIVKTTGDGALIEFGSVVGAVQCALTLQRLMAERNGGVPDDRRMDLRIGVHLGDVLVEDDDILGDGVNIAARLEGIAEPGGICISEDAFRQVRGRVDAEFDDIGQQSLKNITRPLRVYHVRLASTGGATTTALPLPDKPSLAVLPYENLTGDVEQDYFVDGIVEEITTAIARLPWLFVIARNSSFTYKGKAVDLKQVGRELCVRYVLEGSVRKTGNRIRITGQLIDTATGAHIWADRFDGALDDIFELQDQVASSVDGAIEPRLRQSEIERARRKPTGSLDAYDLYLRALAEFHKLSLDGYRACIALLRRVLEIDPSYMPAAGLVGWCRIRQRGLGAVTQDEIGEAVGLARQVIASGNDDPDALWMAGFTVAALAGEPEMGIRAIERALALNPNSAMAWCAEGYAQYFINRPEPAIDAFERAIRLSPLDPFGYGFTAGLAFAHFAARRYEAAIGWADRALGEQPRFPPAVRLKVALCGYLGRLEEGHRWLKRMLELDPGLTIASFQSSIEPYLPPDIRTNYIEGLRKAGLPEE